MGSKFSVKRWFSQGSSVDMISRYIYPNCQMHLSKLSNVFVQIAKCIYPNCQIYLSKFPNVVVQIAKYTCPNWKQQGRKQSAHFLAIKQSFYSLLNWCHKSWTASQRQIAVVRHVFCHLLSDYCWSLCLVTLVKLDRRVVPILSRGAQQPRVLVTVSLFWSQFHWQIPPNSPRMVLVGRMRPLWYKYWCMHQKHQVLSASEDCGRSRRVDGASNRRHTHHPGAPPYHATTSSPLDWVGKFWAGRFLFLTLSIVKVGIMLSMHCLHVDENLVGVLNGTFESAASPIWGEVMPVLKLGHG